MDMTVLGVEELGLKLPAVSSLALQPGGGRCYVGTGPLHGGQRENLAVVDLPGGEPRWYADSPERLAMGSASGVAAIVSAPALGKLYLAVEEGPKPAARPLTVYDLVDGEPSRPPRSYPSGTSITSLVPHRQLELLYTVGQGSTGVTVHRLVGGEPDGAPVFVNLGGNSGQHEVAVSADGRRLYLGTIPETLRVLDLDDQGMPVVSTLRTFPAGPAPEGPAGYLRFIYTPQALYRRRLQKWAAQWPLVVWRR